LVESTMSNFFSSKATLLSSQELHLCSPSDQSCLYTCVSKHIDQPH
jgi:hypothetical protein